MNLSKSSLLLAFCSLSLSYPSTNVQAFAGMIPQPQPLTGNGIYPAPFKPLHVSLSLTPANNDGTGNANLGTFLAEVGAERNTAGLQSKLSVCHIANGQEKLVTTATMNSLPRVLGGPVGFNPKWSFSSGLSDKTKFPLGLVAGSYRAEVIIYPQTPPITGPRTSDPRWVEAGGAAVDFQVGAVNLLPVTSATGNLSVTVTVIPRRGATSAQLTQLNTAARNSVSLLAGGAKQVLDWQSLIGRSEPTRNPWIVKTTFTSSGLITSFGIASVRAFATSYQKLTAESARWLRAGILPAPCRGAHSLSGPSRH